MEIILSDQSELDGFLSSAGIPSEQPQPSEPTPDPAVEQQPADAALLRDPETGRFAPKPGDPPQEQQPPAVPPLAQSPQPEARHQVPLDAVTALRGENRELKQLIQQLTEQVRNTSRPQPAQQQEKPQQPADFWADPAQFVGSQLSPIQQDLAETRAMLSHIRAVSEHGKDAVVAAHQAIREAIDRGEIDRAGVEAQLERSRDPVGDIMRWHQTNTARTNMQRIGNDPDKWLESELEKRMADPAFQAKVIERARTGAGTGQPQQPVIQIPPSLSRIPTGANAAVEADISNEGLFAMATKGMR